MHRAPPISAHRLLSNGRSTALIRPDGEIDWWCWPHFDSDPQCWSLLDEHGGALRFPGAVHAESDDAPAGPATKTHLRIGDQRVECLDALLTCGDTTELVRLVRGTETDLDVLHTARIGGFGGSGPDPDLRVHSMGASSATGEVETCMRAPRGEWVALVAAAHYSTHTPGELYERICRAMRDHEKLLRSARFPAANVDRARDALAVLHACTDSETGAVIASPTTSLPEVVGGDRQFDYRYSWLRDASAAISVASMLGQRDLAEQYTCYLDELGPDGILDAPLTRSDGSAVPDEQEIDGVAGWNGSRPVRTGNAASSQVQYDAVGMVLDALYVHTRRFARLGARRWEIVRALADRVAAADPNEPSNGIWEMREPAALVSADIGRWLGLDRAIRLTRMRRPVALKVSWIRARSAAQERVLGAIRADGSLPQIYDADHVDASALLLVIHRLLPARDLRAGRLVDATIGALGCGPFLYRYPPDGNDGFSAGEAPFVPASWWAVSALAVLGRPEARERADALCSLLPRLQSEQFDPTRGESLGNTPLVWSHAEAARALYEIDHSQSIVQRLRRR